jgi:selenocysteine lyase/cysteine desulfurase
MTIPELFSSEELRREEFPVCREKVFLAHAGVCPLPSRVAGTMQSYILDCTRGDQETLLPAFQLPHSRSLAARLLRVKSEEIAFVGPTSLGLSFVAGGLQFRENDNVVLYFDDYPSNVYPWMALAKKGVEMRFLKAKELGRIGPEEVLSQVDGRTGLVALASCHFVSGYRVDLEAVGSALHRRGILFAVDGIQTLGAFPAFLEHVDFLAADAHKWMLGPCAAGILYVKESAQDRLQPMVFGWNNVRCPKYIAQDGLTLRSHAKRYEAGTHNLVGLIGMTAALELLLEVGVENIAAELLRKRAWMVPELQARGCQVLQADASPANASGIVTFFHPELDMQNLYQRLEAANIITSLRTDRSGREYIRLSPHFYNTDAELHRVLEFL